MKKIITLLVFAVFTTNCFAQGLWTQKSNFPASRLEKVSFTIGSYGYKFTGDTTNNFYRYDPSTNTWTHMADFPGPQRYASAGFTIGNYGFIGSGNKNNIYYNDFYKYDAGTNSWDSIAAYPDTVSGAFSFSIAGVGYVAAGIRQNQVSSLLCFAYDTAANTWTAKANIPYGMNNGFSEALNTKGYCGLGRVNGGSTHIDSVYEYDPALNSWASKANFHLANSNTYTYLNSFVVNNKIYVADPHGISSTHAAMQVYDPALNSWSTTNSYPYRTGTFCESLSTYAGFSIGNKGYLGGTNLCSADNFWEYDPSNHFTITAFNPDTLCERESIAVTISSSVSFNPSNHFKLNIYGNTAVANKSISDSVAGTANGTYTFVVNTTVFTGSMDLSNLSITSTNPPLRTDFWAQKLLVKKAPIPAVFADSYASCGGSAVTLYRAQYGNQSCQWTSDPPGFTGSFNSAIIVPTQNMAIFTHEVQLGSGCVLDDTTSVYYADNPLLNISDSSFIICPGGSATIGGTATSGCSYSWTGAATSTLVNPVVSPAANAVYHVQVTDTASGCKVKGNTAVIINTPPAQDICFVTVDSLSNHNIVVWEKVDIAGSDSFYIYRETSTSIYTKIGAVHRDSLSEYHDYTANPNITAYRYKISTRDTCFNEAALSHYHNTIHIQYLGTGNLIWNVYQIENEITPVSSFDVYVDANANGSWQVLVNVPGNQYTATDINFSSHPNARYRVVANWAHTCTSSRSSSALVLSNIIQINPTGIGEVDLESRVALYPVPAQNELIISSGDLKPEALTVFDEAGRLVLQLNHLQSNRVNVSRLANGVYFANIQLADQVVRKRFIKIQ